VHTQTHVHPHVHVYTILYIHVYMYNYQFTLKYKYIDSYIHKLMHASMHMHNTFPYNIHTYRTFSCTHPITNNTHIILHMYNRERKRARGTHPRSWVLAGGGGDHG